MSKIASRSGVAKTTIHRYFKNKDSVPPEIRKRIDDAMLRLDVVPPAAAIVLVIVPHIENPYFTAMASAFEHRLRAMDICPFICSSENDPRIERQIITDAKSKGVRAWVLLAVHPASRLIKDLVASGDAVVVVDRIVPQVAGNYDCIGTNNERGIQIVVDQLVMRGHTKIGYLGGMPKTTSAEARRGAFDARVAECGLQVRPEWTFEGRYDFQSGVECAQQLVLMEQRVRPTAIVAANDLMAIGLITELQKRGVQVPRQMSVTGFDNIAAGAWLNPRLTTIDQSVDKISELGCGMLCMRIRSGPAAPIPPRHHKIDPEFVLGQSIDAPWRDDDSRGSALRIAGQ